MLVGTRVWVKRPSTFGVARAGDLGSVVELISGSAVRVRLDRGALVTLRRHEFEIARDADRKATEG